MVDRVRTLVVGAGVVGLAVARRLAPDGDLLVIEAASAIGSETSSRNSEVIHAGMYYAPGSLKARTCVAGRRMLYDYCRDRGVAHRRLGKLIVATDPAQHAALAEIAERAARNGLTTEDDALERLSSAEAAALEPGLRCTAALRSSSTGIVDTHGLMLALLGDAENEGAALALNTRFVDARRDGRGWHVRTRGSDGEFELHCDRLVNAAGLHAQAVARATAGMASMHIPEPLWLKGNYFSVAGRRPPFRHLIYPIPSGGGLGVHLTLDLQGQARFGPDTEPVEPPFELPDYRVDPQRAERFYDAIRSYWPELEDGTLQPAYAGMRPKLHGHADAPGMGDFVVSGPKDHGAEGLLHFFGIESPGITASLALAELAAERLS